jgi:chitinase
MKTSLPLIVTLLFCGFIAKIGFTQHDKEIVGYYPNWQWYDRSGLVDPESIMYEKYTVINYAFFRPLADGSIVTVDAWADENLLLGPMIWWPVQTHDSTKSLPYLAHQAGVKVLPSIGGWNDSYNFPGIAASAVKRQTFVESCINLIIDFKFDGIDLDWEYPGYEPNGGTPDDKENFTYLCQELRAALDELELQSGNEYLLTTCIGSAEERMQNIDFESILPTMDMINLMTYDFHGSWDPESNHHTPLYSPAVGNPDWCFDGSFTKLTQEYNVPAEMINIGIAFYGKGLANCTGLYQPHTGYDGATFWEDEGQPLYYNIMKKMDQFTYYWDEHVKCPYLLGNSINTFVTYDDLRSVGMKAQYVKDYNANGIIIWEITGDYMETSPGSGVIEGTPLLDTIHAVFDAITSVDESINNFRERAFVYPNPTNDIVHIEGISKQAVITIYNSVGTKINFTRTGQSVDVSGFPGGIYFIEIKSTEEHNILKFVKK